MKRIMKKTLEAYDREHDTSLVRELEMTVDAVLKDQAYSIQFWKDMSLYGLSEAVTYLESSGCLLPDASLVDLHKLVAEIGRETNEQESVN